MKTNLCKITAPDTQETLLTVFRTEVAPLSRGFTAHHHTFFEIAYFTKGRGTYMVSDRSYPIRAGDFFLFSADEVHFISDIEEEISALVLHVAPFFIWAPGEGLFDQSFLQVFFEGKEHLGNRIAADDPLAARLSSIMNEIEEECTKKPKNHHLMIKVKLLTLLITLLRAIPEGEKKKESHLAGNSGISAVQSVLTYIGEHYTEDLTLGGLAAVAGVSRNYLSTVFRRLNGMTVWSYILIKRIDLAKSYLAKTNRPILDIAADCGFSTAANFNKAFKSLTGLSPSAYRRAHGNASH